MEPSSLIFLVIIGIWGAYFVQYWVRRREHLATIRSVDAFSETMRVLQVRAPLPSVEGGSSLPRTSAVSPARAMRPQVTVKRAEAYAASPAFATSGTSVASTSSVGSAAAGPVGPVGPSPRPDDVAVPSMSPSRATRGVVLLVGVAGTLVFGLLAAVGVLVGWAFAVPLLMAVGGFVWLRSGVQAEAKARRAARGRARRAAGRTASASATHAATSTSTRTHRAEVEVEVVEPSAPVEAPATSAPYDVSAQPLAQAATDTVIQTSVPEPVARHEVVAPELDEDDIPLTWDPRPVPRPTYTMKARAPQRPVPQAEPDAAPERTAYEDEAPQRRVVGG